MNLPSPDRLKPGDTVRLPTLGHVIFVDQLPQGVRFRKWNGKESVVPPRTWELLQPQSEADLADPSAFAARRLGELYDFAASPLGTQPVEFPHTTVSEAEATRTEAATGLDTRSYTHVVDSYAIRHGIRRHGADKAENMGQLPVTKKDFQKIPEIVSTPDTVRHVGKTDKKLEGIEYTKTFPDGNVLIVEEMRTGRKNLALTSIRKRKVKESAAGREQPASPDGVVASTSETVPGMTAKYIIPGSDT